MTDSNELTLVIENTHLEKSKVENLLESFGKYFNEAKKIAGDAKSIIVTDESQTGIMQEAREARLKLKNIRVEVEKRRIELKEQSLREGRAIDGIANVIKALVVPVEEHLEKQEKYAEIKELERIQKRYEERIQKITPYVEDITLYNVKDMSDDAFAKLLESFVAADKAKKEQDAKAEAERLADEARRAKLTDRRIELAPYEDYITFPYLLEENTTEKDYQEILTHAKSDKKIEVDKQEKIRKENEELRKKSEADRKAKEEAETKLKEETDKKEKAEREAKEAEEAKKREEDEKQRKALLAPDKEKLLKLADDIDTILLPAVSSREAGIVIEQAETKMAEVANFIRERSKTL